MYKVQLSVVTHKQSCGYARFWWKRGGKNQKMLYWMQLPMNSRYEITNGDSAVGVVTVVVVIMSS